MKVLITQSNYIPWKGYFDAVQKVDTVILYDEMQYTRRDWRNRNKIKTPQGLKWLTIPVDVKNKYFQKINETKIKDFGWSAKHWKTIQHNYSKAPFYKDYKKFFENLYQRAESLEFLSEVNYLFLSEICKLMEIKTTFKQSKEFELRGDKSEKLLNICLDLGTSHYFSGPAAQNYLDEKLFQEKGITVEWLDYSDYPKYSQLFGEFEHGVSIIDLIFNVGKDAKKYMKHF